MFFRADEKNRERKREVFPHEIQPSCPRHRLHFFLPFRALGLRGLVLVDSRAARSCCEHDDLALFQSLAHQLDAAGNGIRIGEFPAADRPSFQIGAVEIIQVLAIAIHARRAKRVADQQLALG